MLKRVSEAKGVRSELIEKIRSETPLRTKLKVTLEMMLIHAITELGYRPDKMWTEDENDKLKIISDLARSEAEHIVKMVQETKPELIQ